MRGEAKEGPRRAAHRDAAPEGGRVARDLGAGAVDRNAEGSREVRAEEVESHARAWGQAAHLAAEPCAAEGERVRREREPGAQVHPLPEETAAEGGLVVDPKPSAGCAKERGRVAGDEEPALVTNADARARAEGEPARGDADGEHAEASCPREFDDRIGASLGAAADQQRDQKATKTFHGEFLSPAQLCGPPGATLAQRAN